MRIRDKTQVLGPYVGLHGGWHPSTGWQGTPSQHTVSVVAIDVMHDVVTRNFKSLSAQGRVFNSPMFKHTCTPSFKGGTYSLYRTENGSTSGYRRESTWGAECVGSIDLAAVRSKTARVETLAITEAYSKVGEIDIEALVMLGEAKETAAFLASPIGKMRAITARWNKISQLLADDLVSYQARLEKWNRLPPRVQARRTPPKLRKRKLKMGSFSVTDISSAWLAYRYGLMPLIYDVQGILALLQRQYGELRQTARAGDNMTWTEEEPRFVGPYGFGDRYIYNRKVTYKAEIRAGVLAVVKTTFPSLAGLTLDRIPSTIWELTRLSFVVDWFLNIGDFIGALTAHARGDILASWCTVKVSYEVVHEITSCTVDSPNIVNVSAYPRYKEEGVAKWRYPTTLQNIGIQGQFDLNLKRWIDAFALIHQSLAKNSKLLSLKLDFKRSSRSL